MRRLFAFLILGCIAYFVLGWGAVYFEWLPKDTYLTYAGIVGGLASVLGLLAFTRPTLTNSDLRELELNSLKSIAETTEELQQMEQQRTQTREEIASLDTKKKEMELLVKKASLGSVDI
jgi:hypothetical protein